MVAQGNRAAQPLAVGVKPPAHGVDLLRLMMLSREGDRREAILMRQGKGWFQVPGMGHEAMAALAAELIPDDFLFPFYRDRALVLARGMTTEDLALDFLARQGSSSEGRNMPAHTSARALNIFSIATPTGAQCLPAVGAAQGLKLSGSNAIVLCSIGDAATRQGEFFEAVCQAVQDQLPIVFVVEDNQYAISTPTEHMLPFRLDIFNANLVECVNGRVVTEVIERCGAAIRRTRGGAGPSILWCELDRLGSHTSADDQRVYRAADELESLPLRDPILLYGRHLIAQGQLADAGLESLHAGVIEEVDSIYARIDHVPFPSPSTVMENVLGPQGNPGAIPAQPDGETDTIVAAVNRTLRAGLGAVPTMLMTGEDIEDPKGGVFGITKGLSTDYPERVRNSALAEATIVGTAVGLAGTGYRPVFELQFIDFITPAFNQLVVQASSLRWRTAGSWTCPAVFYAPYGAYLPAGGIWHSQSNEGWFAHIPGLRVAVPSTPEDAAGLFWSALHDNDPTLILLPKHIFRVRMPVRANVPVPFGKAAIRRAGTDVTIVAWGNCLEVAEQAADEVEKQGVSVEIVDLRSIVPCDWQTIEASLSKTGRLVVVHEDTRTCGFGQAVIAEMTSTPERFFKLIAPPQLVARPDVHIPFCPTLELSLLPSADQVVQAIHTTLE